MFLSIHVEFRLFHRYTVSYIYILLYKFYKLNSTYLYVIKTSIFLYVPLKCLYKGIKCLSGSLLCFISYFCFVYSWTFGDMVTSERMMPKSLATSANVDPGLTTQVERALMTIYTHSRLHMESYMLNMCYNLLHYTCDLILHE